MNFTVDSSSPVRGWRAVRSLAENAPSWIREMVAVEDVEHVEDVTGASYEAEHLGDVHGVARPRVRQQFAELRALKRVEVPVSSSNPRGSSIWASARTRSCRAVDYWSVDTLL